MGTSTWRWGSLALVLLASPALGYEEPAYEVVSVQKDYETRRYAPYIVAETTVEGSFDDARNEAFRRLFRYISGNNLAAGASLSGSVEAEEKPRGEKIKMTIPVGSRTPGGDPAALTTFFVMPSRHTLASLPRPSDARITLREVPARLVAARRYSGRTNEKNFRRHEQKLRQALERDQVRSVGTPVAAVYNGPFTLPFLRRNEILIEIAP